MREKRDWSKKVKKGSYMKRKDRLKEKEKGQRECRRLTGLYSRIEGIELVARDNAT